MNKLLLSINLYSQNEKSFITKCDKRVQKLKSRTEADPYINSQLYEDLRKVLLRDYPPYYYNEIVGFCEIRFSSTDICIEYYMSGDRRKKFNKEEIGLLLPNKIYKKGYKQGDAFVYIKGDEKSTNSSIKKVLVQEVIGQINLQCKEWNIYFEKEKSLEFISCFDFKRYLKL